MPLCGNHSGRSVLPPVRPFSSAACSGQKRMAVFKSLRKVVGTEEESGMGDEEGYKTAAIFLMFWSFFKKDWSRLAI